MPEGPARLLERPAPPADPGPPRRGRRRIGAVRLRPEGWAYLFLGLVGAAVVFLNDWGVFYPDNQPQLYLDPSRTLSETFSTWLESPKQGGFPNFNVGAAPVALLMATLDALGLPPWAIVRVWRAGLLLVGGWGMVRLLRVIWPAPEAGPDGRSGDRTESDGARAVGRVAAVVVYLANPFVVLQGGTGAVLLPHALLPWLLLSFVHAVDDPRRWRWPAGFALVFFAMTGMNAGVIPLMLLGVLPCYLVYLQLVDRRRWLDLVRVVARCGVLALGVSLYWLVPSAMAAATGGAVAGATEDYRAVASTTSWSESLRLTGLWTLYGRAGERVFTPAYTSYLTTPLVVASTFAVPALAGLGAWASRARVRAFAAVILAAALPVMVGIFPPEEMTPFGRTLDTLFARVPGAIAFRTTNKLGTLIALAVAILVGVGAAASVDRLRGRRPALQAAAAVLAVLALAAAAFPGWSGNLYRYSFEIPPHWEQAAAALDDGSPEHRVLIVPGGVGANYRWASRSPDEVVPVLTERPVVIRSTVAAPGDPAGNFMATFDDALNSGTLPEGSISTVARYLGADAVLVRNDTRWEEYEAMPPSGVTRQLGLDPGLEQVARFGVAGTYTLQPEAELPPATSALQEYLREQQRRADQTMNPLVLFEVVDPPAMARSAAVEGTVVVDGDGAAVGPLVGLDVLDGDRPFLLAGDLSAAELATLVEEGVHLSVTDTNRRREGGVNRVREGWSATLGAGQAIDAGSGPSPTLFPDRIEAQSFTELEGVAGISATRPSFDPGHRNQPFFAFDGDPTTSWLTGHLYSAEGKTITVELSEPATISWVDLTPVAPTDVRIATAEVRVGDWRQEVAIPGEGETWRVEVPDIEADRVSVEITGTEGDAIGGVGFAEIAVDGLTPPTQMVVMPTTLADLVAELPPTQRSKADALPFDVVMVRQQGRAVDADDDEERALNRRFELPSDRSFELLGEIGDADQIPQEAFDELFGGLEGDTSARPVCVVVATVDGEPLRVRVEGSVSGLVQGRPLQLRECDDAPLELEAGVHELRSEPGWVLDRVALRAPGELPEEPPEPPEPPEVDVVADDATSLRLRSGEGDGPWWLITGRGFDGRWTATVDGTDLGPPVLLDGYTVGWRIDDGTPHDITVEFAPQRTLRMAVVVSAAALAVVVVLFGGPAVLRRRQQVDGPANPKAGGRLRRGAR